MSPCDPALFEKKSTHITDYGLMRKTNPAPGVDPALSPCIMVQKAGNKVYSKEKLLEGNTVQMKITRNVSDLAQIARSHGARLHLFSFDAGDKDDPECPQQEEVYRDEIDKNSEAFAGLAYVDGVPVRYLAPTAKEALAVAADKAAETGCEVVKVAGQIKQASSARLKACLLYTSPSPRDLSTSRMPSSA